MPLDRESGCETPGTHGTAVHQGEPLTCDQIRELPDGAEVVITWSGGNGPHPYRVLVDAAGTRRVETIYADPILHMDFPGSPQRVPLHRVTPGWDGAARARVAARRQEPEHIRAMWTRLRGSET